MALRHPVFRFAQSLHRARFHYARRHCSASDVDGHGSIPRSGRDHPWPTPFPSWNKLGEKVDVQDDRKSSINGFSPRESEGEDNGSEGHDSFLSETTFDQCTSISPSTLKAIKDVGFEKMTIIQEEAIPVILQGRDVLGKARTGSGKTMAYLVPSIEVLASQSSIDRDRKHPPISVLVICPTRELACQSSSMADALLKYHTNISVQVVMGGTKLTPEQKHMKANPSQILVATPGRLSDHINNTPGFRRRLKGVKVLVLDEADRLFNTGFRPLMENIISVLPKERQTLMFSASLPEEVRTICHVALRRDHEFISTIEMGEDEEIEPGKANGMHLVAPLKDHFLLLYALLEDHISHNPNYKVIVFCTTRAMTVLVSELLLELQLNVREVHSDKPQSWRRRISDEFRRSTGLILVTSGVSGHGVDYPSVTLVVQLGLPTDRRQYLDRLATSGTEGTSLLLLSPWETFFLGNVSTVVSLLPPPLHAFRRKVERALCHVDSAVKVDAYVAWLCYYSWRGVPGCDSYRLADLANQFSRTAGLDDPPALPRFVLSRIGFSHVPRLRIK